MLRATNGLALSKSLEQSAVQANRRLLEGSRRNDSAPAPAPPATQAGAGSVQLGGLDGDALAAAAGVGLVRVAEHELGGELGDLVVDLGADQEQDRLGLHQ